MIFIPGLTGLKILVSIDHCHISYYTMYTGICEYFVQWDLCDLSTHLLFVNVSLFI